MLRITDVGESQGGVEWIDEVTKKLCSYCPGIFGIGQTSSNGPKLGL